MQRSTASPTPTRTPEIGSGSCLSSWGDRAGPMDGQGVTGDAELVGITFEVKQSEPSQGGVFHGSPHPLQHYGAARPGGVLYSTALAC